MDRTVIDTWKAEEKEFGEKLHRKLTALTTLIQPPTDEFKKCFVEDMFLKPNQKAFFHVMHYLFTLLDPVEFKKRFYWPIADKKSEANFRSSSIQYLMHLNEKHNLQWNNIKSYLVVMPGGMKFIVFLLDFIDFITKELIKQREKVITSDLITGQLSDFNIKRMMKQNKLHKEYASRYIKATDQQVVNLKDNLDSLRKYINTITVGDVPLIELMDDTTLTEFAINNRQEFDEKFRKNIEAVTSIEDPLNNLKKTMDRFQNHEAGVKYDKELVKRSLLKIKLLYPDLEIEDIVNQTDLQIGTLLGAFNRIYPDIECNIAAVQQQNCSNNFISNELSTLKTDILQIETQVTKFLSSISEETLNPQMKITPMRSNAFGPCSNVFFSKFINTPPIKLDIVDNKMNNNPRLPFLDDFIAERTTESFCLINTEITVPRCSKKVHDNSMKLNLSALNKSKIVDPLRLLRTLNKDKSKFKNTSRNLSSLASKWKKHESLFDCEDVDSSNCEGNQTIVTLKIESPPILSGRTAVALHQLDASFSACNLDVNNSFNRKISAVQKVQDASLNFQNLSTSPSGRLDPLVAFDPKEFSKILLQEDSLLEKSNKSNFLNLSSVRCPIPSVQKTFKMNKNYPKNDENDPNASNFQVELESKMENISSDDIFDISDGVLKDITM